MMGGTGGRLGGTAIAAWIRQFAAVEEIRLDLGESHDDLDGRIFGKAGDDALVNRIFS